MASFPPDAVIDPAVFPLPPSGIPSLNNSPPGSTMHLPDIPTHPPPGVAPLPRFRSERLLPAPNMAHPLPPTFSHLYISTPNKFTSNESPNSSLLSSNSSPRVKSTRSSPDRFIPSSTSISAFRMSTPLHLMSRDEKLLRRSNNSNNPFITRDRSLSPPSDIRGASPGNYRSPRSGNGIWAAGRAIYVGAGSSRGTEVNINVSGDHESPEAERERHEARLAAALGVDRCARVLNFIKELKVPGLPRGMDTWNEVYGVENRNLAPSMSPTRGSISPPSVPRQNIPSTPFRVLDAPGLRDDYYCSLLAYSSTTHSLAVGLHSDVYTWTEATGATPFENWSISHVTSLAFSSPVGKRNILAIGRIDGNLCLWKPGEARPRIERMHTAGVACIAWRPVLQKRWDASFSVVSPADQQLLPRLSSSWADCEDLLVGDEMGVVYYYTVLWDDKQVPEPSERKVEAGGARTRLLRKIVAHTQQICGLSWSSDGGQFATGGNDNVACLFNVDEIFLPILPDESREAKRKRERGKYRWAHGAAVKAMAFCPWQHGLLATGGGSNDRSIHFFHTKSGACLATINVSAQVTSLLWSNSRREIAATFGYANPDHPIRIAVFSWPECKQVAAIPWGEDMRALYAVAYPAGLADSAEEEFDETDTLNEDVESETDEDVTSDHLERVVALRGRSHERSVEYRPQARAISEDSTEASNTNSLREGELNRGRPVALALRPALGSAISTSTSAHNNMFSRSHSRGRPMDRIGPAPIRPVTRTSPSAAQAASLRRRRTRSGREGGTRPRSSDGCIVVAASDETVRFHEVWSDTRRGIVGWRGVLGGSDILEGLEGIEKDGGECIR